MQEDLTLLAMLKVSKQGEITLVAMLKVSNSCYKVYGESFTWIPFLCSFKFVNRFIIRIKKKLFTDIRGQKFYPKHT